MVYQYLMEMAGKVIVRLVGGRLNKRRRRDILRSLREQGLGDDEVAELGPFVQATVEYGGVTKKIVIVLGRLLVGAIQLPAALLIGYGFPWVGLGLGLFGLAILWAMRRGVKRQYKLADELEGILRQNPRWLLRPDYTEKFDLLLDNTDYDPEMYGNYDDVDSPPSGGGAAGSGGPRSGSAHHPTDGGAAPASASPAAAPAAGGSPETVSAAEKLRSRLFGLDEREFREFVAALWRRMGWAAEVTRSGDESVVLATGQGPSDQRLVIATRHEAQGATIGTAEVEDVVRLQRQNRAGSVLVVTTAGFTTAAENRANELGVKLVDGEELVGTIEEFESRDLVTRYLQMHHETHGGAAVSNENDRAASERTENDRAESVDSATGFGRWHWVATGSGVLAFALGADSLLAFLALVLVAAVALYGDIRHVRRRSSWSPRAWFYVPGTVVLLSLPVYLVNRYRYVSSE